MIEYENLGLLNKPFRDQLKRAFDRVLKNGRFILGDEVEMFEKEFADYNGSRFCIGVASGLDALYLSLKALNFPAETEVLVPSNTYIATILSVVNAGLKPILVEPHIDSYNIDPILIKNHLTSSTRALMITHLYGKPCQMDELAVIAQELNLVIIEDCAQAHGAEYANRKVGTWGELAAFSFYPTKNLGALGDGGAIVTDNEEIAIKLKALRNYGSQQKYVNKYTGINSRLDELQAAFLRIKLKHLDKINSHKAKLADIYTKEIRNNQFVLPMKQKLSKEVYHIFNIRCNSRQKLKDFLLLNGIKTEIHYPIPPHHQEGYKDRFKNLAFPISEEIHNTTLSLPISYIHSEKIVRYVCQVLNSYTSLT